MPTSTSRASMLNKFRRHPRVRIPTPIACEIACRDEQRWFGKSVHGPGVVYDLSLRGMRVSTEAPIKPGDHVSLLVRLPRQAAPAEIAVATVRWETVAPEPTVTPVSPPQERKISWFPRYRWVLLAVVIGIVAVGIWKIFLAPAPIEVASVDRMKYPLPDKPSIAVLPFANMSDDPKQEFLSDGMTEAIITALSKIPGLFVFARSSTFTYKGKPVKVKQISEDLGVRYVLEGSLQRSGDRLRITAQLIDALTAHHLWAESYDRELKDIFALQDEITLKILTGVQVKFSGGGFAGAEKFAEKYYTRETRSRLLFVDNAGI